MALRIRLRCLSCMGLANVHLSAQAYAKCSTKPHEGVSPSHKIQVCVHYCSWLFTQLAIWGCQGPDGRPNHTFGSAHMCANPGLRGLWEKSGAWTLIDFSSIILTSNRLKLIKDKCFKSYRMVQILSNYNDGFFQIFYGFLTKRLHG